MEKFKRGVIFWVLLLVSVALPASAQKAQKKILYEAQIKIGSAGKGGAQIVQKSSGFDYMVRSFVYPDMSVVKVYFQISGDGREIILCENGGLAGDCAYIDEDPDTPEDGNVDIEGAVTQTMLNLAGVSPIEFYNALQSQVLTVQLNQDGEKGSGTFIRRF